MNVRERDPVDVDDEHSSDSTIFFFFCLVFDS